MPVSVAHRCVVSVSRVNRVRSCLGLSMQTTELRNRFGDMRKQHFGSCKFEMDGLTVHGSLVSEDEYQVRHRAMRDE